MKNTYISSRHLSKLLMDHFHMGYCYIDPALGLYKFSPELFSLFGRPTSDKALLLEEIESWMPPADAAALRDAHNLIILKQLPPPLTLNILRPTGVGRQIQIRFEAVRVSMDAPPFILALAKDVTQSASQANALKITSRRLQAVSKLSEGRCIDNIFFFDGMGNVSVSYSCHCLEPSARRHFVPSKIPTTDLVHTSGAPLSIGVRQDVIIKSDIDAESRVYSLIAFPVIDENQTTVEYLGVVGEKYALSFLTPDATKQQDILRCLTGHLVKGARSMASLTTHALCKRADISPTTLAKIEDEAGPIVRIAKPLTAAKILAALEQAGLVFSFTQDGKLALCAG